jgi:hypothetical protein
MVDLANLLEPEVPDAVSEVQETGEKRGVLARILDAVTAYAPPPGTENFWCYGV